ncbi:MAG: alpha-ketoglutarate-dependent dioxygenase AlkB [Opitutae bacterium]|jgi:alkylated DNA repair dioxygenase AlkB|nr:alpha-ketoglutarate-dependent dioxygenase AlkB [Opitutae bacterium]MBT5717613.1 alpha-ketoglutarate-dependent dioxygenase AlkB [Opitutae bacterium]
MKISTDELFSQSVIDYELPDAIIRYYPSFFSSRKSSFILEQLLETIQWKQNTIKIYGKENPIPRLEAWYGDPGKSYAYSGIHMTPIPWTKELKEIKGAIEIESRVKFNSVLINLYRNGKDRVAWHSDDEKELGKNPVIGSVSFGAERIFKLRHKKYKSNNLKKSIMLRNGSFLLMKGTTQHHWMHEIPRTAKRIEPRINLTFRVIK